ncbi:MAG TPA: class I SAM-dependent methyltransferase [Candidatus Nocardiopsis merdipullorum]|nr:class I SAM-dependent methyltransferase [Candidatus Nocardiopsis merdipullorum]
MTDRNDRFWRRAAKNRSSGGASFYREQRHELLNDLSGTVLEIGPGSGPNFGYLPSGITWVGLEPNPYLHERLRTAEYGSVLCGDAESIPLADGSVDAVVGTIVLCSIDAQSRVLSEVIRVLRPGGRFVFLEHVGAERGTWSRWAQQVVTPFSRRFDGGCDATRDTGRSIENAGFARVEMARFVMRGPLGVNIPHVLGQATTKR